jgi:hypothetical protein
MAGLFAVGLRLPRFADQLADRRHLSPFVTSEQMFRLAAAFLKNPVRVPRRGKAARKTNRAAKPKGLRRDTRRGPRQSRDLAPCPTWIAPGQYDRLVDEIVSV